MPTLHNLTGPHHLHCFPQSPSPSSSVHKLENRSTASEAVRSGSSRADIACDAVRCVDCTNSTTNASPFNVTRRKTNNLHLPRLFPALALRPRGSFSSCSSIGPGPGATGSGWPGSFFSGGGTVLATSSTINNTVQNLATPLNYPSGASSNDSEQKSSQEGCSSYRQLALIVRGKLLAETARWVRGDIVIGAWANPEDAILEA
ncbi:hypothetical protein ElyMa_005014300 [Elysia marginata]|uniref:Uncharacterized protein n=1 Tax=Elysia marginata TaxID=1093978 RepID=A0AAV4J9P5_9GAST|nr:hypothetical protein ElyMa_005014300 [Elysia marginata]